MSEIAPNGKPFESVWDFPRPPRLEQVAWRIRVVHAGMVIADAPDAIRVLETSQPPAYYLDPSHIAGDLLVPSEHRTYCEWKGIASYADIAVPGAPVVAGAAWRYLEPTPPFEPIAGRWAFYAQRLDECSVDGEVVIANEGSFYGGWITSNVTGPFKGGPGTSHW